MVKTSLKPPVWVARPAPLQNMAEELGRHTRVAIDTESNSLYAYKEQVCLIQFSVPETDYLLDTLALGDLTVLGPLFANPDIEKIFHAAEYDLICLKRDYGFEFNHIFDTMQAGRILGRKEIGLGSILKNEFGLQLEKRYQRANWGARPLTPAMLAYARLDSHYLIDLRDRLAGELEQKGLMELAREDFEHLTRVNVPVNDNQPGNCWRLASGKDLSRSQCAVLQALLEYRDQQAQRADLPPFKILNNQTLIDIATACPDDHEQLLACTHLSVRQSDRFGNDLLQAVQKGLVTPPPPRPSNHRPEEAVINRIDALKNWRKVTARTWGVESDVVLPKDLLETIAFKNPRDPVDLNNVMTHFPWRFHRFNDQILNVIKELERS